ncbi:nicotinate (nicotinamide) nucleotide adenylyltransferase [Oscillatoria sp. FACHB-1407]|uniref:nicotinate (nicotinamide) nucleotide adenylyltransferase n=1 Tax=Oscillatoria sp. FACHB-1407 TaxID=2692847 RepID=UPI00168433EE|nr:nicotinate (nicotinamide) nucleotide adenylyltransferase [Oscillatoria sp. FACHB-1407]MBD2460837.1 nicotinate (nicotinamide) nucleotide adenylyltransferase [Oscillatoria sp. FACHB-1407]
MPKLGILGGTFNPIHLGHLLMAEAALDQFQLDQVIWVPAHHPPHRSPTDLAEVAHRVAMVQAAIASHPAFVLSTVDLGRSTPSFAIDTLTDLQQHYPHSQWHWIVGIDTFQTLPQWYQRHDLVPQCYWLVAPRFQVGSILQATEVEEALLTTTLCTRVAQTLLEQQLEVHWQVLQMPLVEISSSLIRQYRRDRRSIRYLVTDNVLDYIEQKNLYL